MTVGIKNYGQARNFILFDQNPGYTIEVSLEIPRGCGTIKYRVEKTGHTSVPEIVSWDFEYKDCNNKDIRATKVFEISAGNTASQEYTFQGANITDVCIKGTVRRTEVQIPKAADVDVHVKSSNKVFDGETIDFDVQEKHQFNNINWQWIDLNTNKQIATGKEMSYPVNPRSKIGVRGRYGTSRFQTEIFQAKIPTVNVINDLLSFDLQYPDRIDDTSLTSIKVRVTKNLLGKIDWAWYKGNDVAGKPIQSGAETELKLKPLLKEGDSYTVYAVYDESRKIASKSVTLNVNTLAGPDNNFEVGPSANEIYRAVPAWIKVSRKSNNQAKWFWEVGGIEREEHTDSIRIDNPVNNTAISVYPVLNTKKGIKKTITLKNVLVKTVLPKNIAGPKNLCNGDVTQKTYTLENAVLGTTTKYWTITDGKQFTRTFRGDTVRLSTRQTTTYQIIPEPAIGDKVEFTVTVTDLPHLPSSIQGPDNICQGTPFRLSTNEHKPSLDVSWNWYKIDQITQNRSLINEGDIIYDSIRQSTTYQLQSFYKGCVSEQVLTRTVVVISDPVKPGYILQTKTGSGKKRVNLSVDANDVSIIRYQWSDDNFKTIINEGVTFQSYSLKKGTTSISVRSVNECETFSPSTSTSLFFNRQNYFFVNAGLVSTDFSSYENMMLTIGIRWLYLRAKFNPFYIINSAQYSAFYNGTQLTISDNGRVQNFPPSTGNYYSVNSSKYSSRKAATLGTLIGSKNARVYIGGGYGEREMIWGLGLNSYTNGTTSKVWARNTDQSWKGIEIEAGVFLKTGKFNLMTGGAAIIDKEHKVPFFDIHVGIGFTTK